jgi:tetratricopeptide (TPR) repeat protein
LEAEARKKRLYEFLDQFRIDEATARGIDPRLKKVLRSHGVETAADLIEEAPQIPSAAIEQAKALLDWRRDLEKKFVFDPARDVPAEARIKAEKEIDALRFRLESELTGGAHYLRRIKQDIETSGARLRPALTRARQALAQAEKDMEVAGKRNPAWKIMAALIFTFVIALMFYPPRNPIITQHLPAGASRESSGSRLLPPPAITNDPSAPGPSTLQEAVKFYQQGNQLLQAKRFVEADEEFRKAINIEPTFFAAYEAHGYALYHMKYHVMAAEVLNAAIRIHPDFNPCYNLGLIHFETENWREAIVAFRRSTELRDESSWKDEYSEAYYRLGLSLARAGELYKEVKELETSQAALDEVPIHRFRLGIFYLCFGWYEDANRQQQLLEQKAPTLAKELMKLINKYGRRV